MVLQPQPCGGGEQQIPRLTDQPPQRAPRTNERLCLKKLRWGVTEGDSGGQPDHYTHAHARNMEKML